MQKVINVLAILSFAGTAGIVGGGAYVYVQRDALIENAKSQIAAAAGEAIAGALPDMMSSSMPELPGATGGAVPMGGAAVPMGGGGLPF